MTNTPLTVELFVQALRATAEEVIYGVQNTPKAILRQLAHNLEKASGLRPKDDNPVTDITRARVEEIRSIMRTNGVLNLVHVCEVFAYTDALTVEATRTCWSALEFLAQFNACELAEGPSQQHIALTEQVRRLVQLMKGKRG